MESLLLETPFNLVYRVTDDFDDLSNIIRIEGTSRKNLEKAQEQFIASDIMKGLTVVIDGWNFPAAVFGYSTGRVCVVLKKSRTVRQFSGGYAVCSPLIKERIISRDILTADSHCIKLYDVDYPRKGGAFYDRLLKDLEASGNV